MNHQYSDEEKRQKVFSIKEGSIKEHEDITYRCISFVVKSGKYGIEGDITNRHTQQIIHHRSEDEADVKEFTCLIYVPKDTEEVTVSKGICVFQSIATYGIKTITVDFLRRFFSNVNLTIITRSVSVRAFLEKLIEQGNLYKITMIRNRLSPNLADNMLISTGREESSFIYPTFKHSGLHKLLSLFDRADKTGICEIPDDMNFDDISIQFKLGESMRTVRLKTLEKLSIVEDVPDEVVRRDTNEPLIRYMIATADAYKEKMVFFINDRST